MSKLQLVDYKSGFAIFGDTKPYSETLKAKGFSYNPNLDREGQKTPGWFVKAPLESLAREFVKEANAGKVKGKIGAYANQTSSPRTVPTKPSRVSEELQGYNTYNELSSYTDIYIANRLALSGEEPSSSALVNRYNYHVSLLSDGPNNANLDTAFDAVFRSDEYSEVSDLDEIATGAELGKHKIALLPRSNLFDGHMCLTALRLTLNSQPSMAYGIQVVRHYDADVANSIQQLVPKKTITKKSTKTSAPRVVPTPKEEVPEETPEETPVEETTQEEEEKPRKSKKSPSRRTKEKRQKVESDSE
jgi:hypothetical protein